MWHLQVARGFACKSRPRPVDALPRGEQGTSDERKEIGIETGTGVGTGEITSMGMSTRVRKGAASEAATGGERTETRI